jgi:hypothetical protein
MIWDKQNLQWERNYQKAAEYFAGHGNLEIPRRNGDPGRLKIAAWLDVQRQTRRGETKNAPLSEAQIKRLDAIGMNWGGKFLSQWEKIYRAAREYYAANGHLNVPAGYKTPDGILLGKWIYRQRNSAKLTGGQKALLDEIGMDWRSYVERARAER